MLGASMLAAGALVVTTPADPAQAAPLACDQNTVFAINSAGAVISVNITTGATASVTNALNGRGNALGVSPGGASAYALGGDVLGIWDADAPAAESIPIPGAATPARGAIDPSSGLYYYAPNAAAAPLNVSAYRRTPASNIGRVAQLTGSVGGGGDLAFSQTGVLFVAAGTNILRANSPIPTTAPTGATPQISTSIVASLGGSALNGVAFSGDGYLYATTNASALQRINPASGALITTIPFTGPQAGFSPIDLASCNYANTTSSTSQIAERKQAGDQFTLAITGGGVSTGNTATSSAAQSTITAGPVPALGGSVYTVRQTAAGTTDLADYVTTYSCRTASGSIVSSGSGGTATYTQPASTSENGSDISCSFANVLSADAIADSATTPADTSLSVPAASGLLANDDGVGLEVVAFTQPASGSVVVQPDGSFTYTPAPGGSGTTSFSYTIEDDSANRSTGVVTVAVTPTADADSVAVPAGSTTIVPASALLDGDRGTGLSIVSASIVTGGGSVSVNGAGDVVYTPAEGYSGAASFLYTVRDAAGKSTSATVSVTVGPSAAGDSVTAPAGSTTTFPQLRANDAGTGLVIVDARILTGGGSVSVDAAGDVVYTPQPGYSGPASFSYDVRDASGNLSTATVSVAVTPSAVPDTRTVDAGATTTFSGLSANDLGTGLEITAAEAATGGATATVAGGTVTYTPAEGFSGTDTVTYTATDDSGQSTTGTVTVTVTPTARADARAAASAIAVTLSDLLANDSGSALSIATVGQGSSGGTVTLGEDDSVSYRSAASFSGTETFAYTIIDANGASSTATVTMTVAATAADDAGTTDAQTELTVPAGAGLLANDSGTGLEVIDSSPPASGSVTVDADGSYRYLPRDGFSGTDTFGYSVRDDAGTTLTRIVMITVRPTAADDTITITAGSSQSVEVLLDDIGTGLELTRVTDPAGGGASIGVGGRLDYAPDEGFSGIEAIDYQVTDDSGQVATATFTITVLPRVEPDAFTVPAGQSLELSAAQLLGNDSGTDLEVTAVAGATGGTAALTAAGGVAFQPAAGFSGTASFRYTATDASGLAGEARVIVLVGNAATPDVATVAAGASVTADAATGVLANDSGTGLTAALDSAPTNGRVDLASDGSYSYTPAPGFSGTDVFTYTATDAEGQLSTGLITVTVTPTAVPDSASTDAGTPLRLAAPGVLGNDLGSDLRVTGVSPAANGTIEIAPDGAVFYTPRAGFSGTDTVSYEVTDSSGQITQGSLEIVVGVRAVDDSADAVAGQTLTVPAAAGLLANDEGAALTASLADGPANGTATVNADGSFTYTPKPGFSGVDTFTYRVTDAGGLSTTATVTITVVSAAVAGDDVAVALPGQPVVIDPFANDAPTGGAQFVVSSLRLIDPVTGEGVSSVTVAGQGTWRIVEGKIEFTPADGFAGVASIAYEFTDTAGQVTRGNAAVTYPSVMLAMTGVAYAGVNAAGALLAIVVGIALLLVRRRPTRRA